MQNHLTKDDKDDKDDKADKDYLEIMNIEIKEINNNH